MVLITWFDYFKPPHRAHLVVLCSRSRHGSPSECSMLEIGHHDIEKIVFLFLQNNGFDNMIWLTFVTLNHLIELIWRFCASLVTKRYFCFALFDFDIWDVEKIKQLEIPQVVEKWFYQFDQLILFTQGEVNSASAFQGARAENRRSVICRFGVPSLINLILIHAGTFPFFDGCPCMQGHQLPSRAGSLSMSVGRLFFLVYAFLFWVVDLW